MVNVNTIVDTIDNQKTAVQPSVNDGTSNYFYANQISALSQQILRVFSNFYYQTGVNYTGDTQLLPIPCRWGDASRMVTSLTQSNSQNTAITAPIFAVYITEFRVDAPDRKLPVGESQLQVNERAIDPLTGRYTDELGAQYEVNRLMSIPYIVRFKVDYLFSNQSQQWQALEQIGMLFNPSIDIQLNNNPFDWGALTQLELEDINYNAKTIPVGTEDVINVTSFTFAVKPFWLNPPAKVKKLIEIRNIITDVSGPDNCSGLVSWTPDDFMQTITTVGQNKVSLAGNELVLLGKNGNTTDSDGNPYSWTTLLSQMGNYDPSTTIIRLRPSTVNVSDASHDIIATFALDPNTVNVATLTFDTNTLPGASIAPINGFINPKLTFPGNGLPTPVVGTRYIITSDIIPNTVSWGAFSASENSVIAYTSSGWTVANSFDGLPIGTVVENLSNRKVYSSITTGFVLCYEGAYNPGFWRVQFFSDYAVK